MEPNTSKFRLRLNLFDGIVLVLVLALGAFLLWSRLKPAAPAGDVPAQVTSTVRYTVRFQRWLKGTGALVQEGDALADVVKNYELGRVVSAEVLPAETLSLDHSERAYIRTTVDGYEDVLVTIEAPCTISDNAILLGGGYPLRTGAVLYIRGEGYMASAPVISMEREELK